MSHLDNININIDEGYRTVHEAFKEINFASFDYDSVKSSLVTYLQLNYPENFNDYVESSEIIMIIESFAYVAELLSYRIDLGASENYITQAERKDSVLELVNLISYNASRRLSARGLVKLNTISTTQSVKDSRGLDLKNKTITWNDPNNAHWQEQFFLVIQEILQQSISKPIKFTTISGITYSVFDTRIINLQNGVFGYDVVTSLQNVHMELASADLGDSGPIERAPAANGTFGIFFVDDGLGMSSFETGFMMYTVEGELLKEQHNFDQPLANRKVELLTNNVNNTDVYVSEIDSVTTENIIRRWNVVDAIQGDNLYFNTTDTRYNYEIITLDNDGVELHFGDGIFSNIPSGIFTIWSRRANNEAIVLPRSTFKSKEFSFVYADKDGNNQTSSVRFSLVNSLTNAASSEDIEHIRRTAPGRYYTQDRMTNARDYNTFLLQDNSVLKLKAVNRTFSGASKYQKWNDASGNYQNIKLTGDDLLLYVDSGYKSIIYKRDDGGNEFQLVDVVINDILTRSDVIANLRFIQGVISPRNALREDITTEFTYTGSSITAINHTPYPLIGHDQEKTEIQGRIDGRYYGVLGVSPDTFPVDGIVHNDFNMNVYVLDVHIPAEAKDEGVLFDGLSTGLNVKGTTTLAEGTLQSWYQVPTPDPIDGIYTTLTADWTFFSNVFHVDDPGVSVLVNSSAIAASSYIVITSSNINVSASAADVVELELDSVIGTSIYSIDHWRFLNDTLDVVGSELKVDGVTISASNYNALNSSNILIDASSNQVVELSFNDVTATYLDADGVLGHQFRWRFVGVNIPVALGVVKVDGVTQVEGTDYVVISSDLIHATFADSGVTVQLYFSNQLAEHQLHTVEWNFPNTLVGASDANISIDASVIAPTLYSLLDASTVSISTSALSTITASASQTIELQPDNIPGVFGSSIFLWEFPNAPISPTLGNIYLDASLLLTTEYNVVSPTQITTAISGSAVELVYNEAGIIILEASSTAALSFDDFEELHIFDAGDDYLDYTGNAFHLLSEFNVLNTYQEQDGSGGSAAAKAYGRHIDAINSGSTSNDAFGIGYDALVDQYYSIAPENLGIIAASYSREFARDTRGGNFDDSWLLRITPIRSDGETQYSIGFRVAELTVHGITKDFYYQNDRSLINSTSGLIVEDTFTVLGVNYDVRDEFAIGDNVLFPVVYQPTDAITGRLDHLRMVVKEFDTNQDGIPDDRNQISRIVDLHSTNLVLAADGRHNDLELGEQTYMRDQSIVYGTKPHTFDFTHTSTIWQEVEEYYGEGSWHVNTWFNNIHASVINVNASTFGLHDFELPEPIPSGARIFFDGNELLDEQFSFTAEASTLTIDLLDILGSVLYVLEAGDPREIEVWPRGIIVSIDDSIQLASTINVPIDSDFTIETIMRMDNVDSVNIIDGFRPFGSELSASAIDLYDRGYRLSVLDGDTLSFTFGGHGGDDITPIPGNYTVEYTPMELLPDGHNYSLNINDGLFHHIALVKGGVIQYEVDPLFTGELINNVKIGDRITDVNGTTGLVKEIGEIDATSLIGNIWVHNLKFAPTFTEFSASLEAIVVHSLLPDGTYGDSVMDGYRAIDRLFDATRFFIDGKASPIHRIDTNGVYFNLDRTVAASSVAVQFKAREITQEPTMELFSNPVTSVVDTTTANIFFEGLSISRELRFGESFNDVSNPKKKFPRIFPQTLFFKRDDTLSNYLPILTPPTPKTLIVDNNTSTINRLYKELLGRDELLFMWTHFTPRANLVDPSKTNIIDMFVHTRGYQSELDAWIDRNNPLESQPAPPSTHALGITYNKYIEKAMLSDTVLLHPGKIRFLFGNKAKLEDQAVFRVVQRENSLISKEQLTALVLEEVNKFFDIANWDFGQVFYFTELATSVTNALFSDVQSILLVPLSGGNRFGDLFQIIPASDEILQSATTIIDVEIIEDITRQNIRRSDV